MTKVLSVNRFIESNDRPLNLGADERFNSSWSDEIVYAIFRPGISVPEPSILALMLTGMLGLGIVRRRKF